MFIILLFHHIVCFFFFCLIKTLAINLDLTYIWSSGCTLRTMFCLPYICPDVLILCWWWLSNDSFQSSTDGQSTYMPGVSQLIMWCGISNRRRIHSSTLCYSLQAVCTHSNLMLLENNLSWLVTFLSVMGIPSWEVKKKCDLFSKSKQALDVS